MQPKTISWGDSVRAWASGYKDSVAVDYDAANMKYVYVHKSLQNDWKKSLSTDNSMGAHNTQFWLVPTFFAILCTLIIFAIILYRDNNKALNEKRKDTILGMMRKDS